jgi:tetratricopeptide (TPR) repeat protein
MLTGKLVFSLLRRTQKNRYSGLFIPLAISILILLIFLPANLTILLITYILLASLTPVQTVRSKSLTYLSRFPILKDYIFISIILFILFSISLCFKLYTYDLNFRIASSADTPFSTGKIEKLKQLTTNVPWKEPYHLGYAYFLQSEIQTQYGLLEKNSGLLKPLTSLTMETVEEIKIAIRLHPDSSTNWKTLGRAYELASKLDPSFRADAIRAYEESMRLDPNSPEPMVLLGRLYGTLDQTSEAGQLIRNALKLKPDYANAYYQLAIISAKQENYIEAAAFMSNAIFLTPKTSSDLPRLELELNRLQKLIK